MAMLGNFPPQDLHHGRRHDCRTRQRRKSVRTPSFWPLALGSRTHCQPQQRSGLCIKDAAVPISYHALGSRSALKSIFVDGSNVGIFGIVHSGDQTVPSLPDSPSKKVLQAVSQSFLGPSGGLGPELKWRVKGQGSICAEDNAPAWLRFSMASLCFRVWAMTCIDYDRGGKTRNFW